MPNNKIKITFVIPTYNRKQLLSKLLQNIHNLRIPENIEVLTIVIDDGSHDGTYEHVTANFPQVMLIRGDGNWWWTRCINEGMRTAIEHQSDFILIMNDDNEIDELYLMNLWGDYLKLPPMSILGSISISIDDPEKIDFGGVEKYKKLFSKFIPYRAAPSPESENYFANGIFKTKILAGRGTLVPVSVIEKIGMMDLRFPQYASDDDFTLSANEKGINVFISWNAVVKNHSGYTARDRSYNYSFLALLKFFFNPYSSISLRKSFWFYYKHAYPFLAVFYATYVFLVYVLKYLKKRINNLHQTCL